MEIYFKNVVKWKFLYLVEIKNERQLKMNVNYFLICFFEDIYLKIRLCEGEMICLIVVNDMFLGVRRYSVN